MSSAFKQCLEIGVKRIEVSAPHKYQSIEELKETLVRFRNVGCEITLHNYFPAPKDEFILNIASNDQIDIKKAKTLVTNALELSCLISSPLYGLHPGYLSQATKVEEGKFVFTNKITSYANALDNAVMFISNFASQFKRRRVKLLVENLFPEPDNNHSLCCTFGEICEFMNQAPQEVGLLLDLGHLNVSSKLRDFDRDLFLYKYLEAFADRVFEVHLSENNGILDEHLAIKEKSWQLNAIKLIEQTKAENNAERIYCIEARNSNLEELRHSVYLVNDVIS